jgi:hypothetical protein
MSRGLYFVPTARWGTRLGDGKLVDYTSCSVAVDATR